MKSSGTRFTIVPVAVVTLVMALAVPGAFANVGRVEFSIGDVTGIDSGGKQRRLIKGSTLSAGDTVRTGRGRAQIRFTDGGYTSLQPNTEFRIDEYNYDAKRKEESVGFFSLLKGGLRTITGIVGRYRKKAYQLRTPVATVGIRGTEYLAELGNSLTVHVGEGEIEVCSNAGCTAFGAYQTGYVASAGSLAVLAERPPSLAPPQERQVYAYSGGYQGQFDAAADYRASDDLPSGGLPDGPFYALAVSWGENTSLVDLFATGLLSPSGELTDARFDSNGGLSEYFNRNYGSLPIQGDVGSAQIEDVGIADGTLGWGRWTMGSAIAGSGGGGSVPVNLTGSSSHHYAIGIPTAVMPTNPATYSLVGATRPTLASGSGAPGTLNSANLVADFASAAVTLNMDMTVNGNNYLTTNLPMTLGSAPNDFTFYGSGVTTNSSDCISVGCNTYVEGFFAGDDASHAGLAYKTGIPGDYINGAAAFKKDATPK
jgi:FecR protein